MGVEAGVPRAQPVPLHDVIPYLNSNDLIGQPAQAPAICDLDFDKQDPPGLFDPDPLAVDFIKCTEFSRLLHIVHNA